MDILANGALLSLFSVKGAKARNFKELINVMKGSSGWINYFWSDGVGASHKGINAAVNNRAVVAFTEYKPTTSQCLADG